MRTDKLTRTDKRKRKPARTDKEIRVLVGKNARRLRATMAVSRWEVADEAGITVRMLQQIEAGKIDISLETLATLCVGLYADVTELFEEPPPPPQS